MRIFADENIDRPIISWLREQGHDVVEAVTAAPGAADIEVVRMSREDQRVLMTFDRDIGRIVLSDSDPHPGVIFLRLRGAGLALWEQFKQVWPSVEPIAASHLVTVRNRRIRRRSLGINPRS